MSSLESKAIKQTILIQAQAMHSLLHQAANSGCLGYQSLPRWVFFRMQAGWEQQRARRYHCMRSGVVAGSTRRDEEPCVTDLSSSLPSAYPSACKIAEKVIHLVPAQGQTRLH